VGQTKVFELSRRQTPRQAGQHDGLITGACTPLLFPAHLHESRLIANIWMSQDLEHQVAKHARSNTSSLSVAE
jgi:hypothetical protein